MSFEFLKTFVNQFFVTGDPMIYAADVLIILTSAGIVFLLSYFKKWGWLWNEWLTTVDHKKIGVMYILSAVAMLFRAGADALMIRLQLAFPGETMQFLNAEHYNGIFTTHGTIMILFMAMPFLIGLMNVAVPLQIGARDVAYPYLNAFSFWTFFSVRCCLIYHLLLEDPLQLVGQAMRHLLSQLSVVAWERIFIC